MRRDEGGSAATATLVMLPLLLSVLVGVLELGVLRIVAYRATSAADLATTVAVNDQDRMALIERGTFEFASDVADVARTFFARNLEGSADSLAATPIAIASQSDIAIYQGGAVDARTGVTYARPTVRLIAGVPVRTPGLSLLLLPSVTTITIRSASSPR
jgi:hypothetical protein